eukprot:1190403-Prorocentrum_minimum.AAC.4
MDGRIESSRVPSRGCVRVRACLRRIRHRHLRVLRRRSGVVAHRLLARLRHAGGARDRSRPFGRIRIREGNLTADVHVQLVPVHGLVAVVVVALPPC